MDNIFPYRELLVGPVFVNSKTKVEFPYYGITITGMTSSCGCSYPEDDKKRGRIVVEFTAPEIPFHLRAKGQKAITTEKTISVKYFTTNPNNIEEATLKFKATVIEKA